MLSARDVEMVSRWARANIPVEVVVAGVQRAMHNAPHNVRSLAYAAPAVDEAIRLWQARQVGAPVRSSAPQRGPSLSEANSDPQLAALLQDAEGHLRSARSAQAVNEITASLCEALLARLPPAEAEALRGRAAERAAGAPPRARSEIEAAQLWRAVRERYHLPDPGRDLASGEW